MPEPLDLFPKEQIVGVFRGFQEGGMEFHADLVLPYRSEFQSVPMHGQFLLVQLETPEEAVLGRISSLSSDGRLSSGSGEEFNIRAMREGRPVPEGLREDYLKYRVNIRVLGVLRNTSGTGLTFVASHRRLPHVGSPVAFPSPKVLLQIAGHNREGAEIGFVAMGEYIYAEGDGRLAKESWMQVKSPAVVTKFPVKSLVSRRTFVFARAGFGKSNLNKLLFSALYSSTPKAEKRNGKLVPVGTVLFDPDGEYFWPDDKGRPGFCDVPALKDQVVVFTSRQGPSHYYHSFVAGSIRLDIRRLRPGDIISIALSPEKQDQQNVRKLKGLNSARWTELVDLIDRNGNDSDLDRIRGLLSLDEKQEAEALAARSNMTSIVRMLHDRSSQMLDILIQALRDGKLCVIDVSQLRGGQSLVLSGLILRRIFDKNQEEFTKADPQTIPTIAVVEEAQSVLNSNASSADPYIEWVKEGRKYDLGAVLITQQPGSIPVEILSQGDNWFIFHLLSAADLQNVRKSNAHFSEDLLSALLNEPIPGQGVFWSSVGGEPYPIPLRVLSFEAQYKRADENYNRPSIDTYASQLRAQFEQDVEEAIRASATGKVAEAVPVAPVAPTSTPKTPPGSSPAEKAAPQVPVPAQSEAGDEWALSSDKAEEPVDVFKLNQERAIRALESNEDFRRRINSEQGIAWGSVKAILKDALPPSMDGLEEVAFKLVAPALIRILGEQEKAWKTVQRPNAKGTLVRYIVSIRKEG